MFRQVKEFDEAHLEDHLSRLAEELGLEEISEVVAEESEDDNCSNDGDDSDSCYDDVP